MKIVLSTIMSLLFANVTVAQIATKQKARKPVFSSINQVGLLTGAADEAATFQTVNGVQLGKWFTGMGTGIHYYGLRSIPLFADVRRSFGSKGNQPFVYADGGLSFPWETTLQLQNKGYEPSKSKGVYYDIGAGYALTGKKNRALLLSAGYSFKQTKNQTPLFTIWSWPGTPAYETYTNRFRTIVIKLGIQL